MAHRIVTLHHGHRFVLTLNMTGLDFTSYDGVRAEIFMDATSKVVFEETDTAGMALADGSVTLTLDSSITSLPDLSGLWTVLPDQARTIDYTVILSRRVSAGQNLQVVTSFTFGLAPASWPGPITSAASITFTDGSATFTGTVAVGTDVVSSAAVLAAGAVMQTRKLITGSENSSGSGLYRLSGPSVTLTFTSADCADPLFFALVKNEHASALATLTTQAAETIEGDRPYPFFGPGGSLILYSDGTNLRRL